MTLGLEFTGEYGIVQRNFDKLDAEVLGTGGIDAEIRFGVATCLPTGPATADTLATTVTHGLGQVPVVVTATVLAGAFAAALSAKVTNFTATTFDVRVSSNVVINFNIGVAWIAIG